MTKWMVPAGVVLSLGMIAVADMDAAQPPDEPGFRRGRMGRRAGPMGGPLLPLGRLRLTDAQQEQIQVVMEENRDATRAAGERVREVRQALQDAVTADSMNEGAIRAVATELGLAEGDAAVQRAYVHAQVWQLLTPEQQTAAREAEAEMQQRMTQRRERMGERRERRQQRRRQG
jgi:Spy/CpxP family protein refolding chaperone